MIRPKKTGYTVAFCYASGQIGFTTGRLPAGTLPILRGPDRALRDFISGVARRAYDGETLLVPGVPEAKDQSAGVDALIAFRAWIEPLFEMRSIKP